MLLLLIFKTKKTRSACRQKEVLEIVKQLDTDNTECPNVLTYTIMYRIFAVKYKGVPPLKRDAFAIPDTTEQNLANAVAIPLNQYSKWMLGNLRLTNKMNNSRLPLQEPPSGIHCHEYLQFRPLRHPLKIYEALQYIHPYFFR